MKILKTLTKEQSNFIKKIADIQLPFDKPFEVDIKIIEKVYLTAVDEEAFAIMDAESDGVALSQHGELASSVVNFFSRPFSSNIKTAKTV